MTSVMLVTTLYGTGAGSMTYRWIDEKEAVHYADRIPPEEAKYRRSKLDSEGREVEVFDSVNSPEQIGNEDRLKQLRLDHQRLLVE